MKLPVSGKHWGWIIVIVVVVLAIAYGASGHVSTALADYPVFANKPWV